MSQGALHILTEPKKNWPKWTQSLCQFLLFTSQLVVYTTGNHMEGKVFC